MNELELEKVNNNLYDDGKIYWVEGKGIYTSKLLEYLKRCGYTVKKTNKVYELFDKEGLMMASGLTRIDFLKEVAIQFR